MNPTSGEEYFYKLENLLLSSWQPLRTSFVARWKEETGIDWWESTEQHGNRVIESLGPRIYRSLQHVQKTTIAKGCLDEWDLSTLSLVLQHFGDKKLVYQAENEGVKALVKLQNALEHQTQKRLNRGQYNEKVGIFKKSLQDLKIPEKVIKKVIQKAGVTSSTTALETAKTQCERAKNHVKNEEFDKALECYGEAIATPSLIPVHLAAVLEKRSELYLKLVQRAKSCGDEDIVYNDQLLENAIKDAKEALEWNENSWKAHHLLAQCFRLKNNFRSAISHYELANAISPAQPDVKRGIEECKSIVKNETATDKEIQTDPVNVKKSSPKKTELLIEKSKESVAEKVKHTKRDARRVIELFYQKATFTDSEKSEMVNIVYNFITQELHAFHIPLDVSLRLKTLIRQLYNSKCQKGSKLDEESMKIRLGYLVHVLYDTQCTSDDYVRLKLSKKALKLYPDNPYFHQLVSSMHGPVLQVEEGLHYSEQGLAKFPNHLGLLHTRASELQFLHLNHPEKYPDREKVIQAHKDYIKHAPFDHPKVPDAYYATAFMLTKGLNGPCARTDYVATTELHEKIRHLYHQGIETEKIIRENGCGVYFDESTPNKFMVEQFLTTLEKEMAASAMTLRFE